MCQRRTGGSARLRRAAQATASAAFVLILAAACMSAKPKQGSDQKAMDAIAEQIQTTIGQQPDVAQARVVYQDNITAPGTASVTAIVQPGAELDPVVDRAVRLIWTSKLDPLESIVVEVTDSQDPKRFASRRLSPTKAQDKAELESKYGPRPK